MASRAVTFTDTGWVEIDNPDGSVFIRNSGNVRVLLAESALIPADDFDLKGAFALDADEDISYAFAVGQSLWARAASTPGSASLSVT